MLDITKEMLLESTPPPKIISNNSKTKFIKGVNDLYSKVPSLSNELVNINEAGGIYYKSNNKLEWLCSKCNKVYEMAPKFRINGAACPKCSIKIVENNKKLKKLFVNENPEWARRAVDYEKIKKLTYLSHVEVEFNCNNYSNSPHTFITTPNKISAGAKCYYCNFTKMLKNFNSLGAVRPDLVSEIKDNSINAYKILANSKERVEWSHELNKVEHTFTSSIMDRAFNNVVCQECLKETVVKNYNDFNSLFLSKLEEYYGWSAKNIFTPESIKANSHTSIIIDCKGCGDELMGDANDFIYFKVYCRKCFKYRDKFKK